MLVSNRLVLLVVVLATVFLVFTFHSVPSRQYSDANDRLYSWAAEHPEASISAEPKSVELDDNDIRQPVVAFNPFPQTIDPLALPNPPTLFLSSSTAVLPSLGFGSVVTSTGIPGAATSLRTIPQTSTTTTAEQFPFGIFPTASSSARPRPTAPFVESDYDFQKPMAFEYPKKDLHLFKDYPPHNYQGNGNESTFAAYLCTRNSSTEDPYFAATLQLVWRMLWAEGTKSLKYPFTVFVAPFIKQDQRDMLAGAGALVRELDLLPWEPEVTVDARRRDAFSKIHLWAQKDFSRIAALDSDIFPIKNIDDIFDKASQRICDLNKLATEDASNSQGICDYTFAAVPLTSKKGSKQTVNVGVMVLQPNEFMHQRLLRGYKHTESYDNHGAEQAFMNWAFATNGPFPVSFLPREYNGYFPTEDDKDKLKVLHEKLWAFDGVTQWTKGIWTEAWDDMVIYFDSKDFAAARKGDAHLEDAPLDAVVANPGLFAATPILSNASKSAQATAAAADLHAMFNEAFGAVDKPKAADSAKGALDT